MNGKDLNTIKYEWELLNYECRCKNYRDNLDRQVGFRPFSNETVKLLNLLLNKRD